MASIETWIGLRYLRAKKRSGFMSFISAISMVGIALGVMVLVLVLSVVNGFQKEVRGQLLNIMPHAEVGYLFERNTDNKTWRDLQAQLSGNKHVLASAPYIAGQVLLAASGEVSGAQIRGILPDAEAKVVDYADKMAVGSFNDLRPGEFDIILGYELAERLGVAVGEKVTVITPEGNVTPAGMVPRLKQFNLVGILKTDVPQANMTTALTHIDDAQTLSRFSDSMIPLRLRLDNPDNAPALMQEIVPEAQRENIWVQDWTDSNRSYFNAVAVEKRMLTLLLSCIIMVAMFNLVSSLVMAVNEKQSDIAILRTLGMPPRSIMKIFVVQGMFSGVLGTFFGIVFGLLLAANISEIVAFIETLAGSKLIRSDVYFLNYMPSDIQAGDVITVCIISLLLSLLTTIYPSWRAARTQPAEALRYE